MSALPREETKTAAVSDVGDVPRTDICNAIAAFPPELHAQPIWIAIV
jgi:hypothetical protein